MDNSTLKMFFYRIDINVSEGNLLTLKRCTSNYWLLLFSKLPSNCS